MKLQKWSVETTLKNETIPKSYMRVGKPNNTFMNTKIDDLVIVRGINSDWFEKNFTEFWIGFAVSPQAIPKEDAYYVGLYLGAPISAITCRVSQSC